jgi:hypothetical protein
MAGMSTDTEKLLAEATEKLKQEAYAAGWHAAVAAMKAAVDGLGGPIAPEGFTEPGGVRASEVLSNNGKNSNIPAQGTTPYVVFMAVKKAAGLTAGQILDAVKNAGHTAPEASIRTNIHRLKERKLIVQRHGKWFAH